MSALREIKLEVPIEVLPHLVNGPLLNGASRSARKPASQFSTYFDTKDFKLRDNHLSLQVRRVGPRLMQSIKEENNAGAALFNGVTWEHEIGGERPDRDAARKTPFAPLLRKKVWRELKPVFESRVRRKAFKVKSGGSEVEVTIESGKLEAGRKSLPLCELGLELKQGAPADLFKLAKRFVEDVPARLAAESDAERGYALVASKKPQEVKAGRVAIGPKSNAQSALQAIARTCLQQLLANQPAMLAGNPEGLHQMRVALRRLRAAISLFSEMLRDPQTEALTAEAGLVARELGPARELEIFFRRVAGLAEKSERSKADIALISSELQRRTKNARARAQAAITGARFRRLVLEIAAWIETGDWIKNPDNAARRLRKRPIAELAAKQLGRRWKTILKKGRRLDQLDARRRHRLRIQTKKLRYGAEFFAEAFPRKKAARRRARFLAVLENLQDVFGELNDIAVHEKLSEQLVITDQVNHNRPIDLSKRAFAAGRLCGHEEARIALVLKEAERTYASLIKTKPFWV
jgi:inorganic triphosphatase YgiF